MRLSSSISRCLHRPLMAYINNNNMMSNIRAPPFIGLLIFSCFCMQFSSTVAATTDTISQGQVIKQSETIISAGENFELGFFTPGNSTNHYVGIWYKKIPSRTIVWVANRDYPCTSASPVLMVNNEGNLVIVDGRISYSVNYYNPLGHNSENASATLLDSGNFILRDGKSNILWQSFDDPSDTFLPGMKLGINRKTGEVWSFTSWKDAEDPDLGDIELKLDPEQPNQLLLMMGSQMIWSTGAWNGETFPLNPDFLVLKDLFNFSFHSNENETYFTYSLLNSSDMFRFLVSVTGELQQIVWAESTEQWLLFWAQPNGTCDIYAYCGSFSSCNNYTRSPCQCLSGFKPSKNWTPQGMSGGGCVRGVPLQCEDSTSVNGDEDGFLRMDNVKFPSGNRTIKVWDAETCKLDCLNNCSCSAYAYIGNGDCFLWDGELLNLQQLSKDDPDRQTIYLRLAASELQNPGGGKLLLWVVVVVVPLVALLPASCICFMWKKHKEKGEMESQDMLLFDIELSTTASSSELADSCAGKGKRKDDSFPLFSFASVSASTDYFSAENKLGEGGFGPVYKGKLLNGKEVAVKRLSRQSGQGLEELKNETMLIAKLQHRNLVRLLGCCLEQGEKILIYEYLPNKSLDSFLFDQTKRGLLGWETRVHIIEGIAQGLLYLHQYSRLRIIHRDLKASNILLDGDMNPKISDFGMARMFGGNELQANTNRIVGTYGYMPPEYALQGLFSIKSDVFSFGVLLVEIVSGKKNSGFYHSDSLNLLGHAWNLWNADRALDLMDPILEDQASYTVLMRYINVALLCVQEIAADRPTMSQVVSMLTNELAVLPCPKQPAFSNVSCVINPEACSLNDMTVSLIEAR